MVIVYGISNGPQNDIGNYLILHPYITPIYHNILYSSFHCLFQYACMGNYLGPCSRETELRRSMVVI